MSLLHFRDVFIFIFYFFSTLPFRCCLRAARPASGNVNATRIQFRNARHSHPLQSGAHITLPHPFWFSLIVFPSASSAGVGGGVPLPAGPDGGRGADAQQLGDDAPDARSLPPRRAQRGRPGVRGPVLVLRRGEARRGRRHAPAAVGHLLQTMGAADVCGAHPARSRQPRD